MNILSYLGVQLQQCFKSFYLCSFETEQFFNSLWFKLAFEMKQSKSECRSFVSFHLLVKPFKSLKPVRMQCIILKAYSMILRQNVCSH